MKDNKSEIKEGAKAGFGAGMLASLCCVGPLVIVLFGLGSISFALSLSQYKPYFLGLGFIFMIGAIGFHLKRKNKTCDINCFSVEGLKKERRFILSVIVSMGIIYVLALYVLVPAISPAVYSNTVSKATQLTPPSNFERICENNGDSWMKMKPMKDGKFVSNSECFGCMPDEKNHICSISEYLNFDKSFGTEIKGSPVNKNNAITSSDLHKVYVKISGMDCGGCATGVQSILQSLNGVVEARVNYPEGTGEIIYNPDVLTKEDIINSDAFSTYTAEIVSDEKL